MTPLTAEESIRIYETDARWGGWRGVNPGPFVRREQMASTPTVLKSDDEERALLYPGAINMLYGRKESVKTWLALIASAQEMRPPLWNSVVYFDYEDRAAVIYERLLQLGVEDDALSPSQNHSFRYLGQNDDNPPGRFDDDAKAVLLQEHIGNEEDWTDIAVPGEPWEPWSSLAVIDGVTEAMALEGLDPSIGTDVATYYAGLPRWLTRQGLTVLLIDHVGNESDGRRPIGSERKLSGIDGAAYSVEMVKPFGRGRAGVARVRLRRDKHGHITRWAKPGEVVMMARLVSHADGSVRYSLSAPTPSDSETTEQTADMEKLSRKIEAEPGINVTQVRNAMGGKVATTDHLLAALVKGEYVVTKPGLRKAVHHFSARPFRAKQDHPDPDLTKTEPDPGQGQDPPIATLTP